MEASEATGDMSSCGEDVVKATDEDLIKATDDGPIKGADGDLIKAGDYVVLQKKEFLKVHELKPNNLVTMGKDRIDLSNILGHRYWTTFRVVPGNADGKKDHFTLEACSEAVNLNDTLVPDVDTSSGSDNRNITDDGKSQRLTTEEIVGLKDQGMSPSGIVGKLIENSTTFQSKTEFAQEKYLKKKQKKYYEYILVRRPTLRLLAEVIFARDRPSCMCLRPDTLSQIIAYTNIRYNGNYLLYENTTRGMLAASILNYLTTGHLINTSLNTNFQMHAVLAMNYPPTKLEKLLNVNLTNIFEFLFSKEDKPVEKPTNTEEWSSEICRKRKYSEDEHPVLKKKKWTSELALTLDILSSNQIDGLILACREHTISLINLLIRFVKPSRPIIVFNPFKEPLIDLYLKFKGRNDIKDIHIVDSFTRLYQVLPGRTHPHVTMDSDSGYLLIGTVVR